MQLSLICLSLILYACTNLNIVNKQVDISKYRYSYNSYDIQVFWNIKHKNDTFIIEGVVKNIYMYKIQNLEITARGIDKKSNKVCVSSYNFFPEEINSDEFKTFEIKLACKYKVEKVTFFYRYNFLGDREMRDLNFSNFE